MPGAYSDNVTASFVDQKTSVDAGEQSPWMRGIFFVFIGYRSHLLWSRIRCWLDGT